VPVPKPAPTFEQDQKAVPLVVDGGAAAAPVGAPVEAPPSTPEPKKEERAPEASGVVPPPSEASATASVSERKPKLLVPEPLELPRMPSRELEVTSNLELMRWRQSETEKAGADSEPVSPWERRAIEVDFSSEDAGSSQEASSEAQEEIPLASVHEFIPTWDPSAESAASSSMESAESFGEGAQSAQLVQLEEALEALRQATTRSALGKVLLSYCQGRFPRGFLLGETFGFAKVGRGYGPGSNKPAVSALQVDLDAPSLLAMAATGGRLVVSSMPESQEDEALFAALGESFSHLMAAPIRASERTVGFVVLDGGPSPFGAEELDDLEKLIATASEAYGRLSGSSF
jgi:hypothetical protein